MPTTLFTFEVDEAGTAEFAKIQEDVNRLSLAFAEMNRSRRDDSRRTTETVARDEARLFRKAQQAAREQQRLWQDTSLAIYGISRAFRAAELSLGRYTSEFIRQAAGLETYRASLQSVTRDAAETERVLGRLLQLTVDLVGVDTQDLIGYAARLQATGLEAEVVARSIEGVTKRVAEQGKSARVTVRVLEQFTQAVNTNIISYRDFIPILREVPTLYRDFSDALGTPVKSLDDLRAAADRVGGPTAAVTLTMQHMANAAQGANLDTLNAQLDIFYDSSKVLAAEIGEHLIPAVVFLFKEVNAAIQYFRGLSDEARAAIGWAAALGTGFTGLVATVGSVSAAVLFLNAQLVAITGASGLSGLGALLAPAGPIVAGFGLATAAISPFVALLVKSRVEIQNANRASRDFARQTSATIGAIGNTEAIEKQIVSLQRYIDAQNEVIRQNQVTSETFRTAPSRARASFASRSPSAAADARERVQVAERQIELLSRLENLQDASVDDLRELDALLARLLTEARQAGNNSSVRELERSAGAVLNAFQQLQGGVESVFVNAVPIRNFSKELVQLRDAAENAIGLEDGIRAAREFGRVRLQQIDAEVQAVARPFIERQRLSAEERQQVISDLQALSAERLRVENDTMAAVQRVHETDYENWREIQDNRIAILNGIRELEVQGFRDAAAAGQRLTAELEQIASPRFRQEMFAYIQQFQNLGLSFDDAARNAREAVQFNRQLLFSYQDTTSAAERLADAHRESFESVTQHIRTASDTMADFVDQIETATRNLQIFDRNRLDPAGRVTPFSATRGTLPRINRRSRTTPLDPIDDYALKLKQMEDENRAVRDGLRDQERLYRQFANNVSGIFSGIITGRINGFEDVANQFIAQSVRIIARAFIEHQIQLRLDDSLTAHKLANQQKLVAAQSALLGGAGGAGSLASFANLATGGGAALGVSALLFPEQIRNLTGGIADTLAKFVDNIDRQEIVVSANITNNMRIGDNEVREISDMTAELKQENRA